MKFYHFFRETGGRYPPNPPMLRPALIMKMENILELEWAGTIEMPINEFTSFVGRENANLLSEPIFIGGFLWRIKTTMRYIFHFIENLI